MVSMILCLLSELHLYFCFIFSDYTDLPCLLHYYHEQWVHALLPGRTCLAVLAGNTLCGIGRQYSAHNSQNIIGNVYFYIHFFEIIYIYIQYDIPIYLRNIWMEYGRPTHRLSVRPPVVLP